MSECCPLKGFEWMTENEIDTNFDTWYILGVDLIYPNQLHDTHNRGVATPIWSVLKSV